MCVDKSLGEVRRYQMRQSWPRIPGRPLASCAEVIERRRSTPLLLCTMDSHCTGDGTRFSPSLLCAIDLGCRGDGTGSSPPLLCTMNFRCRGERAQSSPPSLCSIDLLWRQYLAPDVRSAKGQTSLVLYYRVYENQERTLDLICRQTLQIQKPVIGLTFLK